MQLCLFTSDHAQNIHVIKYMYLYLYMYLSIHVPQTVAESEALTQTVTLRVAASSQLILLFPLQKGLHIHVGSDYS